MNPDQTAPECQIRVQSVCNIGHQSIYCLKEQMTIVVNVVKWLYKYFIYL